MRLFPDHDTMREILGGTRKWARTLEALDAAPGLSAGVAYSIGDSLTYRKAPTSALATEELVGRRRYHLVVAATSGEVAVEVAPKRAVTAAGSYSDLSDRQPFTGSGETVRVPAGGLLVVDIDEAARILPSPESEAVLLHVTVEGASFHNK